MPEFHMTLSPGMLNDLTRPVVVAFDEPENASNVELKLWEADKWRIHGQQVKESTRDDMIAKFKGSVVDGEFKGRLITRGTKSKRRPLLKVQFDGDDKVYELRVPRNGNEHENGVLEITASVKGRIDGRRKRYRTTAPVFVREFGNRRPVVALITGKKGAYFRHALIYWRRHADGLFKRASVEEVLEFVRTAPENRGYGPWGEVNVISHGNKWEWIIRLLRRGKPNPKHLKLSTLKEYDKDPHLLPRPDANQLDDRSRVVLRACVLGENKGLLDKIREFFGGRAAVYAPRYIQWYRGTTESFREQFYFFWKRRRKPTTPQCIAALSAKYPGYAITEREWKRLLSNKKVIDRSMGRLWVTYDGFRPTRAEAMKDLRELFYEKTTRDDRLGSEFEDWRWSFKMKKRKGRKNYRAIIKGRRSRIEVRRTLRDPEGELIPPDLNRPDHFGRSPLH